MKQGNHMKTNPMEQDVRQRMEPGILSRDGFLGSDTRPLHDIVADDAALLVSAEVSTAEAGNLLQKLFVAAEAAQETEVILGNGKVRVRLREGMGQIPCPFACATLARKGELEISFAGSKLILTPLSIHLIQQHGFFQGRGSTYRVEPAVVAALVRLCRAGL